MKRNKAASWWGLYVLIPLTGLLIYGIAVSGAGEMVQDALLLAVILGICGLALRWSESHADLMRSAGVDAQAEQDELSAAGVKRGRYAPSLTATQANYRHAMLSTRQRNAGNTSLRR